MASVDFGDFFDTMEDQARMAIAQHLALLPFGYGALAGGALFAAAVVILIQDAVTLLVIAGIGSALGAGYGASIAQDRASHLPSLQAGIRSNLLGGGMLQLILEHDPYERLPSLRPALPGLLSKPLHASEGSSMEERLERVVLNYRSLCKDMELPLPVGPNALLRCAVRIELAELLRSGKQPTGESSPL